MSTDNWMRLAYLALLLVAIGGWFVAEARKDMGKNARMMLVWGLIFLGFIAGYGLWNDVQRDLLPRQAVTETGDITVPVGTDGHYHLTLELNGRDVDFVVDTGASDIVLNRTDAARIGLDPASLRYSGTALTANGTVRTAHATVERMALGGIVDRNVSVSVNGGALDTSLLGMAYLSRFSSVQIAGDTLILTP